MAEEKRDLSVNQPATLPSIEFPPPYVLVNNPAGGTKAVEAGYLATTTAVVQQPRQVQVVSYPFKHKPDVGGPVCFSLLVLCCCCCPLGLVGLVFAIMAGTTEPGQSLEFIRISNYVNIAGVITGIVLLTLRIIVHFTCGV